MIEVRQTLVFTQWHASLKDTIAAKKIARRIARVQAGLLGDVKFFDGIGELRIDFGPGGDKSSQNKDIKAAKAMAQEL